MTSVAVGATISERPKKKQTSEPGLVRIVLTGTSPLVMHNIRLADPDDAYVKDIAAITSKRKKTEDDRLAIAKLEWFGSLYMTESIAGPAMPTANLRKCFIQAAKVTKQGIQVQRALQFHAMHVALEYPGSHDIDVLFADQTYHLRMSVAVNQSRTMRTRPQFPVWRVEAEATLIPDVMDIEDLERVVALAGKIEGLGDARNLGFGRFDGVVEA